MGKTILKKTVKKQPDSTGIQESGRLRFYIIYCLLDRELFTNGNL